MKLTLGSNIASLMTQRRLGQASAELSSVFERLSSGQRINRASDDAAGLAIADSLRADARIYAQGVRNLNDGISLLNVADSAIENLSSITIRLQELAEQAANGSYGVAQRKALDAEAQSLSSEFLRIVRTTKFNGRGLFTGELQGLQLQAGAGLQSILSGALGGAIGTGDMRYGGTLTTDFGPHMMAIADYNGDGILDLVSADLTGNELSVYLGLGNGSFGSRGSVQLGTSEATSVIAQDFNNDGIMDLVTGERTGSISIMLGNGDGTFKARMSIAQPVGTAEVDAGDFNGDGFMDLAVSHFGGSDVSVFIGRGDGTFTLGQTLTTAAGPISMDIGDVNGDGRSDVVVGSVNSPEIRVFFGQGNGTFNSGTAVGSGLTYPGTVQFADFNQDGKLDIGTLDFPNGMRFFIGDGNGNFTEQASSQFAVDGNARAFQAGDLNGDGINDIVVANRYSNTLSIYMGRGDGSFTAGRTVTTNGLDTLFVNLADFTGDGVQDIVTSARTSSTLELFFSNTVDGISAIAPFSLRTMAEARQALSLFKQRSALLSAQRGQIGAFQSRIGVASNVLTATAENYRAAESRIRDADIAQEAANLVRLQILQQAAAAVLGQANQQPSLVLRLLNADPN